MMDAILRKRRTTLRELRYTDVGSNEKSVVDESDNNYDLNGQNCRLFAPTYSKNPPLEMIKQPETCLNWAILSNLPKTIPIPTPGTNLIRYNHKSHKSIASSICIPILILLLIPQMNNNHSSNDKQLNKATSATEITLLSQLLFALAKFPWDRIKLTSFGPILLGGDAQFVNNGQQLTSSNLVKAVNQHQLKQHQPEARQDLVEEESHVLLLNPNETSGGPGTRSVQGPMSAAQTYQPYRQVATADAPIGYEPSLHPGYVAETATSGGSADYGTSGDSTSPTLPVDSMHNLQPEASSSGEQHTSGLASRQRTAPLASAASSLLQTRADLPTVSALNVKCEKNHMKVNIVFDRPFYGVVFSKGHYNDKKCIHLPANSGQTTVNFEINMGKCGLRDSRQTLLQDGSVDMDGNGAIGDPNSNNHLQYGSQGGSGQQPHGVYIENTIIIQFDSQVQEIYDQARRLRCTWYDYYEKSVTFRPYDVDMLDAVTANFLGDNIQCWMQIQVGKGPKSSEVAGLVKIGQTMTMVLAIKDDENRFDMLVRNCIAHDGKHPPIQLVDDYGCVARPKIMGQFQKSRNFGPQATVVSYAHFQAFKFPDSLSVHFQCVIQVCRSECPPLNCNDNSGSGSGGSPGSYDNRLQSASQTVGFGMGLAGSSAGSGSNQADYAAAGSDVVTTKEHIPLSHQHSMLMSNQQFSGPSLMPINGSHQHSLQIPSSSSNHHLNPYHQIKLDDSQGRVQVKLDTSMLPAGARYQAPVLGSQAIGGGAAPPSQIGIGSSSSSNSGGLATPISGFQLPRGHTHRYQTGGLNAPGSSTILGSAAYKPSYGGGLQAGTRVSGSSIMTGSGISSQRGPQMASSHAYSPQYPSSNLAAAASMVQRAAYATSRIGELAPGARSMRNHDQDSNQIISRSLANEPDDHQQEAIGSALSLLATPRAHRSSQSSTDQQHPGRSKRSLPSENQQSTSIQTQKTIQVISPEDVAFSLTGINNSPNSGGFEDQSSTTTVQSQSIHDNGNIPTVCFSAARFLVGILFALSLLVVSFVVAAILLFRQEKHHRFREKELHFGPYNAQSHQREREPFPGAHLFTQQTLTSKSRN